MRMVAASFALVWILASSALAEVMEGMVMEDLVRDRQIPLQINYPQGAEHCTENNICPVVFVSASYGVSHLDYQFLVSTFNELNYMVIAIGHELPGDPPLSRVPPFIKTRAENWNRGAETLERVRKRLSSTHPGYDFEHLVLTGHSNGGDISAWYANQHPQFVSTIITLDHRRVALPRNQGIAVLSIRAGDFPADNGVLPSIEESKTFPMCIVKIAEAKHNDMTDDGPIELRVQMSQRVIEFLTRGRCD